MVELGLVETTEDEEDGGTDALGWSERDGMVPLLGLRGQERHPNKKNIARS